MRLLAFVERVGVYAVDQVLQSMNQERFLYFLGRQCGVRLYVVCHRSIRSDAILYKDAGLVI